MKKYLYIPAILLLGACSANNTNHEKSVAVPEQAAVYRAVISELSDEDYPDNPDISIRHALDGKFHHPAIEFRRNENGKFDVLLQAGNETSDALSIDNINLLEWIPSTPDHVLRDKYLTYIGIINQEWNRHQVKFDRDHIKFSDPTSLESKTISRLDLARNCINAYLWEIIAYGKNDQGQEQPVYHGWFNFPRDLYAQLFDERNHVAWEDFKAPLEHWVDPESKLVNLAVMREVVDESEISFAALNDNLYPEVGERKKKKNNIISPASFSKIKDFQKDSTCYATFSPPGIYNKLDPRKTELSRFANLKKVSKRKTVSRNQAKTEALELELLFNNAAGEKLRMIIGGIDEGEIPQKSLDHLHKGFQMPMGIANHSFYETYEYQQAHPANNSAYFGMLMDEAGNWLDSHAIGIDGPLFHFDSDNPRQLHLWILSFERHSFVGHYLLNLDEST